MADMATRSQLSSDSAAQARIHGLERNIGIFTAITFALACVGLASSGTLSFSSFLGIWPGANLGLILGIGIVLSLVQGYTFSMMGTIAPRSGADYVISSRILGAPISFAASWGMMIMGAFLAGSALAFFSDTLMPGLLRNVGMLVKADAMVVAADALAQPQTVVIVGAVISVIVFALVILPPTFVQTFTKIGFFVGIAAWVIILVQLAFPTVLFSAGWDQWMGMQSYADRIALANNLGMQTLPQSEWLVFGGILIGFYIFFGNWISTYLAGEVKNPERTLLASSWSSTIIAGVLFIGSAMLLQKLVPIEWLSAESYLAQSPGFSGLTMPWIYFYASVVAPNILATVFIFFAFAFLIINLVQMQYLYASRIFVAWAQDEMMPASVGVVHSIYKSPIVAVLLVAVLSQISLLVSGLTGATNNPIEYMFLLAVFQIPPVLAMIVLPFVRPNWFQSAPKIARIKIGPLPLISLTGFVTFIFLLAVVTLPIVTKIGKGIGLGAIILFFVIITTGLLWFYFFRSHQRKQNIPVDEHFKSLTGE